METRLVNFLDHGFNLEIDDLQIGAVEIPSGYESYGFVARLGEHHVITGDKLKAGMIVFLTDGLHRRDPESIAPGKNPSVYDRAQVQETSRWAFVTNVVFRNDLVDFDAVYADGTIIPRKYNVSIKWAVQIKTEVYPVCPFCKTIHDGSEKLVEDPEITEDDVFNAMSPIFNGLFEAFGIPPITKEEFDETKNIVKKGQDAIDEFRSNIKFADLLPTPEEDLAEEQRQREEQERKDQEALDDLRAKLSNPAYISQEERDAHEELFAQPDPEPIRRPKPVWVHQIPVSEIQRNDWLPMGGDLYRVLDVQPPTTNGNTILWAKSLNKDPDQHLSSFVLAPTVLVDVKRRVG